ncbi:MAG: glycerol-3-phosphate 1-O-acyltransferase PlsY [bacterium]
MIFGIDDRLVSLLIGYFIGCLQSAFLVGKLIYKIDIRDYGSGNAGTTNVTRTLGKKAGLFVFIFDVLKGVLAFYICYNLFYTPEQNNSYSLIPATYAGFGTILGHDFPFFLKFKGGKGVATTLGIFLCVDYKIALLTFICGFIILLIKNYISLASLSMALLFPILLAINGFYLEIVVILLINAGLLYYLHRGNIERLIKGEERTFFKKHKNQNN